MKEVKELIIGTRYWLDDTKEVSGVYFKAGFLDSVYFNNIVGKNKNPLYEDGSLGFGSSRNIYKMEESKELAIGTRYWLDDTKDISGVLVSKDGWGVSFNNIVDKNNKYLTYKDGIIGFPNLEGFFDIEEANPLKAMAEEQYCNTNWAVVKYIKSLEEQI